MQISISGHPIIYKVSKEWRADAGGTRKHRGFLGRELKKALGEKKQFAYSSLSHTVHVGGFALAKKPVGFDLESNGRNISSRATQWFASADELALVRDPLYIWVMKEAAFKATRGPYQPKTLRLVKITDVKTLPKKTFQNKTLKFQFEVKSKSPRRSFRGEGLIKINSRTIMGFALIPA
jgi:hypothetical protein